MVDESNESLDPFAMAIQLATVTAELDADDVLRICPHWPRMEAERLLERNGSLIASRMLAAGLGAIRAIAKVEES